METTITSDFLTFYLGEELFAIDLTGVNKVIESPKMRKLPNAPTYVQGIIEHMSKVVPVINLGEFLNNDKLKPVDQTHIILLESGDAASNDVGLLIDQVQEVVGIDSSDIQPTPAVFITENSLISGIVRREETTIMLVDVESISRELFRDFGEELSEIESSDKTDQSQTIASELHQYLTFDLNNQSMAIDANNVQEILEQPIISPVPGCSTQMKGAINLRGNIIPVVDACYQLGIKANQTDGKNLIILNLDHDNSRVQIGVGVDRVKDMVEIDSETISSSKQLDYGFDPEFVEGVFKVNKEFVQLINANKAFARA